MHHHVQRQKRPDRANRSDHHQPCKDASTMLTNSFRVARRAERHVCCRIFVHINVHHVLLTPPHHQQTKQPCTPAKARKHGKASSPRSSKKPNCNTALETYTADGETFTNHTDAFVVVDDTLDVQALWDEKDHACNVCQRVVRNMPLIECDRCLLGYHASCVGLDGVPKVCLCV